MDWISRMSSIWNESLPGLINCVGTQPFMAELDKALQGVAPFQLTGAFAYSPTAKPQLLHNGMTSVFSPVVMERYLQATYLLDCVYTSCKAQTPAGLYRLRDLAPDAFFEGEYYNSPDVHPCISLESGTLAEEIVFLVPMQHDAYVAHSLMRHNGMKLFTPQEFNALKNLEPQVRAFLARHFQNVNPPNIETEQPVDQHFGLEPVFATFCKTELTARERAIVSYVLRGHSSQSIGNILNIAEGTVKNHRKHIYAKLKISSQAELFALFVRHAIEKV
jgi:DNA-binding CsgD family transcriptional regulator